MQKQIQIASQIRGTILWEQTKSPNFDKQNGFWYTFSMNFQQTDTNIMITIQRKNDHKILRQLRNMFTTAELFAFVHGIHNSHTFSTRTFNDS